MGYFRTVKTTFWEDTKVIEKFTAEDRYFFLYLMTCPAGNLSGCFELSIKKASLETGYAEEVVKNLLLRFENFHKVICFNQENNEVLIINYGKHNWTTSDKYKAGLLKEIEKIKTIEYKEYLLGKLNGIDTVSIPYANPMDTPITLTNTNNIYNNIYNNNITSILDQESIDTSTENPSQEEIEIIKKPKKKKAEKVSYGELGNVKLTREEYGKLVAEYGQKKTDMAIEYLDQYIPDKKYKSQENYLAIRRWVMDAVDERVQKSSSSSSASAHNFTERTHSPEDYEKLEKTLLGAS